MGSEPSQTSKSTSASDDLSTSSINSNTTYDESDGDYDPITNASVEGVGADPNYSLKMELNEEEMMRHYAKFSFVEAIEDLKEEAQKFIKKHMRHDNAQSFNYGTSEMFGKYMAGMGVEEINQQKAKEWVEENYPKPKTLKSYDDETWALLQNNIILYLTAKLYGRRFYMDYKDVVTWLNRAYEKDFDSSE